MESLRTILIRHGRKEHRLSRRTLQVLEGEDSQFRQALLEFIVEELSSWDSTAPDIAITEGAKQKSIRSGLRICIKIDEVTMKVQTYLRFKSNRPFPDNGLNLRLSDSAVLTCAQSVSDWSTPLKSEGGTFDASFFDWSHGLKMTDEENMWEAALKGASVRLFVSGKAEGLPDWIEVHRLERRREFLLAVRSELAPKVSEWGNASCEMFEPKTFSGFAFGWTLFRGKNAQESCPDVDVLTLSTVIRFAFQGGIRIGTGTTFLRKALPDVILENATGDERLMVNNISLARNTAFPGWKLSDSGTIDRLRIEVRDVHDQCLQTRTVRITDPEIPHSFDAVPKRGPQGQPTEEPPYAVGSILFGVDPGKHGQFPLLLPLHLARRIIFIGSRPGQIIYWPKEELTLDWQAVWAIAKTGKKIWSVHFCGSPEFIDTAHLPGEPLEGSGSIKDWKSVVCYKVTKVPSIPVLQRLWKQYLNRARNV
jgi:hypothetical protein